MNISDGRLSFHICAFLPRRTAHALSAGKQPPFSRAASIRRIGGSPLIGYVKMSLTVAEADVGKAVHLKRRTPTQEVSGASGQSDSTRLLSFNTFIISSEIPMSVAEQRVRRQICSLATSFEFRQPEYVKPRYRSYGTSTVKWYDYTKKRPTSTVRYCTAPHTHSHTSRKYSTVRLYGCIMI